jgi:hypothetical protein
VISKETPRLTLLDRLTIGYVVTLVIVLAASLITILWYLWRIATLMRQVKEALIEVERNTQPLEASLTPVNQSLEGVASALVRTRDHLAATEAQMDVEETSLPSPLPGAGRGNTSGQDRDLSGSPLPGTGRGNTSGQDRSPSGSPLPAGEGRGDGSPSEARP